MTPVERERRICAKCGRRRMTTGSLCLDCRGVRVRLEHGGGLRGIKGCPCPLCRDRCAADFRARRRKVKTPVKLAVWDLWNCTPTRQELLEMRA